MGAALSPGRRILLVDDHPAVSQRIRELLAEGIPELEVVAVGTGEQGIAVARAESFDLVLLDLRLPGRGGIEILKELRVLRPTLPVVIISSLPESPYATLVRRAGAQGFITKSALGEELERVVRLYLSTRAVTLPEGAAAAQREDRFGE
jgi:two-component system invasion response regulator UvrY